MFWTAVVWDHQMEAFRVAAKYLSGEVDTRLAALFRLPTGTGKTGIMATVINYVPAASPALIVTPSAALTEQVEKHLNIKFWNEMKAQPSGGPQPAAPFVPSTLKKVLEKDVSVFICTTNTLQMLHEEINSDEPREEWLAAFETLRQRVRLVIVDEGHREPAREWADAVRSLQRPTLLFSATPYRNDYRFFRIGLGKDYRFTYRFASAVEDGIIRDVVFVSPKQAFGADASAFADSLLAFYKRNPQFRQQIAADDEKPKVIVRCADSTSVRQVVAALSTRVGTKAVIGIHDEFREEGQLFTNVPHGHEATFWVHQFKLTEGLDDRSFRVVAFFQPFGNARSLVQQIGRVLRNRGKLPGQVAFVFSDPADGLKKQWDGYIAFEASGADIISPEEIVRRFVEALPEYFYFDREYRQAAHIVRGEETDSQREVIEADLRDQLRFSLGAEVLRAPDDFDDVEFRKLVNETVGIYEGEELVQAFDPYIDRDGGRAVMLSWRVRQSAALGADGFFELSLRPAVFYRSGPFIFHQGPVSVRDALEETNLTLVEPIELERLLDSKAYVTQLSLTNCDLGKSSVRRRSMGARSIAEVAPGLADHFHFVASAKGRIGANTRYVGLSRGRVSETTGKPASLDEFCEWCDMLATRMGKTAVRGPEVMLRYAQRIRPPANVKARHLLIDLHEFFADYAEPDMADGEGLFPERMEATSCDVADGGSFTCQIGAHTITDTRLSYDRKKERFVIESDQINELFSEKRSDRRRKKSATAFISQRASVRIITDGGDLYADRHFYRPRIPLWGNGRIEALGIFHPYAPLRKCVTEKGPKKGAVVGDTWIGTSLFGAIDAGKEMFDLAEWPKAADILICDDMGTEAGDFVAVNTKSRRIALIHAKTMTAGLSAADFHVLNSQIVKNLEFFNLGGTALPERKKRWATLWSKRLPRIRRPNGKDAKWAWDTITDLLRKPDTEREVWAVVGPGLSIKMLLASLSDSEKSPPYEVIQLSYLLQSCNATVSSVGARFRMFAPP